MQTNFKFGNIEFKSKQDLKRGKPNKALGTMIRTHQNEVRYEVLNQSSYSLNINLNRFKKILKRVVNEYES